jgi:hypothetical protein
LNRILYLELARAVISGRGQAAGAFHSRTIENSIAAAKTAKINACWRMALLL